MSTQIPSTAATQSATPQGVIAFLYSLCCDPDVQQREQLTSELRRAPTQVMKRFGLTGDQQIIIQQSWQSDPTDDKIQQVLYLATPEVQAALPITGSAGVSGTTSYASGVISFLFHLVNNPDAAERAHLRGEFAANASQLMSRFSLPKEQQVVIAANLTGTSSDAQVQQVLALATPEVKDNYDQAW